MLSVDYSKKVVHIVINTTPTTKGRMSLHHGIIMIPDQVFAKINTHAEHHFSGFFKPGQQFKSFCLETEMGPGELAKLFCDKFGLDVSMWIGGIIAPFTICPAGLKKMWWEITMTPHRFKRSKEKRVFADSPIQGLAVRV